MKRSVMLALLGTILAVGIAGFVVAQNPVQGFATLIQPGLPVYYTTPISATGAVNNQVTLTIPAPAGGVYNYVCSLHYGASQDGTATAQTNAVTTSTNFNSFALKYSLTATPTINYFRDFYWGSPATGCVKSAAAGTATTFVSPAAGANIAFTWYATFYQAP